MCGWCMHLKLTKCVRRSQKIENMIICTFRVDLNIFIIALAHSIRDCLRIKCLSPIFFYFALFLSPALQIPLSALLFIWFTFLVALLVVTNHFLRFWNNGNKMQMCRVAYSSKMASGGIRNLEQDLYNHFYHIHMHQSSTRHFSLIVQVVSKKKNIVHRSLTVFISSCEKSAA